MALVLGFQGFNALESAGPAVIEGEGLGEGLADDVACLVGKEELRVERNDLDCEGGALGRELGIESFKVIEDCLFGFLYLFCTLAGNGDENEMFLILFHMRNTFKLLNLICASSEDVLSGTRFYNNAAKSSGKCMFCCRRFVLGML